MQFNMSSALNSVIKNSDLTNTQRVDPMTGPAPIQGNPMVDETLATNGAPSNQDIPGSPDPEKDRDMAMSIMDSAPQSNTALGALGNAFRGIAANKVMNDGKFKSPLAGLNENFGETKDNLKGLASSLKGLFGG